MKEELFVEAINLKGKTILKAVYNWSWLVLRFTDGTYTAMEAEQQHDEEATLEFTSAVPFELLLDVGVLSKEEYAAMESEEEAKKKEARHWQYLALQKEFGSPAESKPEEEKSNG